MTEVTVKKQRVEYFDVAKAIAILAVICGHTAIRFVGVGRGASLTFATCFTFHLPLFFLVSGYFMHVDRPFSWKKEAKALVLPYAFTALAVVVGVCASNLLLHDWGSTRQLLVEWGSAALYGAGDIPAHPLWPQTVRIGAIWFLLALFWARLVVTLAYKTPVPYLVVLASFVGGYVSSEYLFLPFDIQSGMCAAAFVYLGTLGRKFRVFDRGVVPLWVWPLLAAVWVWAIFGYEGFGMAMCAYGTTPVSFVRNVAGGIAGTGCILGLCMVLERFVAGWSPWKLLSSLGRITLPIMCVHLFEDDVVRWGWVVGFTERAFGNMTFAWLVVLGIRVILDVAIARFLVKLPIVSTCLGSPRKRALPSGEDEAYAEDSPEGPSWGGFGWEGKLLLILVIPCVALITFMALTMTADIDITNGAIEDTMLVTGLIWGDMQTVIVPVVCGVLILVAVIGLTWLLREINPDLIFVVCAVVMFVLQLVWIRMLNTYEFMYIDSRSINALALDYLNGTYKEFTNPSFSIGAYLFYYPFQACSTWCIIAIYSLFGVNNQMAYFAVNAVANTLTAMAFYLLLRHACPRRRTVLTAYSVLMALCVPLWFSCIFLYGNTIGLAFAAWSLLFAVRAVDAEDPGDRLAEIIWSFFLMAFSCFVKSTYILFMFGILVLWVVHILRTRRFSVLIPVLICAYLSMQSGTAGTVAMENISGIHFGKGLPKTTWIAMGIKNTDIVAYSDNLTEEEIPAVRATIEATDGVSNIEVIDAEPGTNPPGRENATKRIRYTRHTVPGWWRWDMYDAFKATNNDYDNQNKIQIESIKESVEGYVADPQSAVDFFGTKLETEWANPDFMTLYYSALGDNDLGGFENNLLYQSHASSRVLRSLIDGYQNVIYCLTLLTLLAMLFGTRRLGTVAAGLSVCFLMGFLCFVLWEAKSVYVLPYYLLLLPLAALGLGTALDRVVPRREAEPIVLDKGAVE